MVDFIFKKPLFGKEIEIILKDVDEEMARDIAEEAYKEGMRLSKIFNFFDGSSELSRLNKLRTLEVSKELMQVTKIALELSEVTKGKYDISLGRSILDRKEGKELNNYNCSFKDIKIEGNKLTLFHKDVLIDLGSIAKGFIVDKIVEKLISNGVLNGIVNGRGDIRVFGEEEQVIGIQHPREERIIKYLTLKNKSVATSGDYKQYNFSFDKSHILNQRDIISITVVADDLMTADVYATVLFVSSQEDREKILNKNKKLSVMTIDKDLNIEYYNKFEEFLVKN